MEVRPEPQDCLLYPCCGLMCPQKSPRSHVNGERTTLLSHRTVLQTGARGAFCQGVASLAGDRWLGLFEPMVATAVAFDKLARGYFQISSPGPAIDMPLGGQRVASSYTCKWQTDVKSQDTWPDGAGRQAMLSGDQRPLPHSICHSGTETRSQNPHREPGPGSGAAVIISSSTTISALLPNRDENRHQVEVTCCRYGDI